MTPEFLSCDWGTTSFRLRRVAGRAQTVIAEIRDSKGIKLLHEEAARGANANEAGRALVFENFLRPKLEALLAKGSPPEEPLPLVISGMASSSIGWRELPYAKLPFPLDGRGLQHEIVTWRQPDGVGPTFLISGLASARDIMRGEEIEIVGLMSDPNLAALRERSLLILPGTHSKHVWIEAGAVVDFQTFMTGELFEIVGRHSILRASVDLEPQAGSKPLAGVERAAFQDGVRWGKDRGISGGLFRVRTRAVLDRVSATANHWFLSGLLIGAELANIGRNADQGPVILGAARGLSEPYQLALEIVATPATQCLQVPPEQVERATVAAHAAFLKANALA